MRKYTIFQVEPQIIRVKAPLFTRVCMAVDISTGMTAGDIVSKLQKRSRLNKDLIRKRFSSANLGISESYRSNSVGGAESPRSVSPCDDQPGSPDDLDAGEQFLFEVGGNIGKDGGKEIDTLRSLKSGSPLDTIRDGCHGNSLIIMRNQ